MRFISTGQEIEGRRLFIGLWTIECPTEPWFPRGGNKFIFGLPDADSAKTALSPDSDILTLITQTKVQRVRNIAAHNNCCSSDKKHFALTKYLAAPRYLGHCYPGMVR